MLGDDERNMLQAAHGVPSNLRDASGNRKLWRKEPTKIDIPTNAGARRERVGHGFTKSDLGRNNQEWPSGNVTARQTITRSVLPPLKRRKVNQQRYVPGRGTPMNQASSSKPKPTPRDDNYIEVLDTDDDQNVCSAQSTKKPDHGATISSSVPSEKLHGVKDIQSINKKHDQDIEATPSDFPAAGSYLSKRKSSPPRFRTYEGDIDEPEYVASSSQDSGSRQVKDGDATRALELQVGLSSDPISDFSPPPQGRVKQMVQHIEKNQKSGRGRHIDFRDMINGKSGIKNSMKTKNPTSQKAKVLPVDETMAPTPFVDSRVTKKLWIEKWIFGTELRENPNHCFVTWEKKTLTIWEDGRKIVWFKLIDELSLVQYCEGEPFIFKLTTKREPSTLISNQREFDQRNHNRFQMGHSRILGEVVIRIEEREDVTNTYTSFIDWLKQHKQKTEVLRNPAGHSVWENASRGAEMAAQSLRRQSDAAETDKDPLKRSVPLEDDYGLTPPPVDELLRDSPSRPSISVSSSRPASRTMTTRREGLRRSTRRRRSPSVDSEEVILCYPQGIPGAVYIKNSDYRRLRPGEFLNDTLIEFGLKLWLSRLQESNPELASQVHVFSSFFYHLLDNKNPDEGYESVRKWTAKIDIFSKKYIIVPINDDSEQHWYLAIIYHPEHILTPTRAVREKIPTAEGVLRSVFASRPSPSPSTTEISTSGWLSGDLASKPPSTAISTASSASADDADIARMNEVEEERSVSEGLLICDPSCSVEVETLGSKASSRATSNIENHTSDNGMTDVTILSDPGMTPTERTSDMEVEDRELSPMGSGYTKTAPVDQVIHDVDMQDVPSASMMRTNGKTTFHTDDDDVEQGSTSITPVNFYGMSAKAMGKQKAIPNQAVTRRDDQPGPVINCSVGVKDDDHEDGSSTSTPENENTTYIFTFDSLGTERLPAIERLARYLKQEAHDKLKRSDTGDAVGFKAQVPVQPNFYDCGLYLLHFAKVFMSDPVKYSRIIRTRGRGPIESRTRKDDWKYEQTVDMRERFRADIEKLSVEWKKDRAEKEEAKRKEAAEGGLPIEVLESSDDEIDIVETTPAPASGKAKKKGGKRKVSKRNPSVMRLR